jgi:hypothetical protein
VPAEYRDLEKMLGFLLILNQIRHTSMNSKTPADCHSVPSHLPWDSFLRLDLQDIAPNFQIAALKFQTNIFKNDAVRRFWRLSYVWA